MCTGILIKKQFLLHSIDQYPCTCSSVIGVVLNMIILIIIMSLHSAAIMIDLKYMLSCACLAGELLISKIKCCLCLGVLNTCHLT